MCSQARYCARWSIFLLLLSGTLSFAQTVYGTIKGALTLKTGKPVPRALILISAIDKGDLQGLRAQTDDSGFFVVNNVPPGAYSLRMRKDGFKTHEEPLVPVSADATSEINVSLTEGDPTDKELGDGSAISILKVDRAEVSTGFPQTEIEALPILLQNVSLYEFLVPGSVRTVAVLSPQQNPQAGIYASLSGQPFSGTTVLIDGTVDRDPLQGIVVLNPSLDSVAELKITTQNYSAEFGQATGGVVSVQTRSGTNQLHGSAFAYRVSGFGHASVPDFGQTSSLQNESQKRLDFGGSLGGPVLRDRLFLFGDYRGIRESGYGTQLLTVPTTTVRQTCTGVAASGFCDLREYLAAKVPFSPKYASGEIPNSAVSPQMVHLLNLLPEPNFGSGVINNFVASGKEPFKNDNFDVRGDYSASAKLSTFGRYSFADFREDGSPAFGSAGGVGTNPDGFAGLLQDRNQGIAAGFSWTLKPGLLTDLRFGFLRYDLRLDSQDAGTTPATDAGIGGLNLAGDLNSSGMPDIQLDNNLGLPVSTGNFLRFGYSPIVNSCNCPLREREQQFQFVDNWTKSVGKHTIRWGGDVRYLQNFLLSSNPRRASHLDFSSGATGNALGDFLVGSVGSFERTYSNPTNPAARSAGERQTRLFLYGEDTWRITPRLTLTYGLRWELYLPQAVTGAGAGGWLKLGSGSSPIDDQFLAAGQSGTNLQGGVQATFSNFGPRLGLAFLVNPKTVVRAGYGRTFDPGYGGTLFGIAATQSPPVSIVATLQGGLTINSNVDPTMTKPIDVCLKNGPCNVPPFSFPAAPFTINDLYNANKIQSPNLVLLPDQYQLGNLYALPRRLRLPTVDAWNVAVQHALDRHTYFEIAYVANKGTHVFNDNTSQLPYYDLNQPTLDGFLGKTSLVPNNCLGKAANNAVWCKTTQPSRQPFNPWTAQVRYFGNDASSNYNSLQVKVRRQFTSGFSLLANYTWARILDFDNGNYPYNPRLAYGVGNFDRAHSFIMTNIWDLPLGRGRRVFGDVGPVLDRIVGGWSLSAITSVFSGLPFTLRYAECIPDIGVFDFAPCRPNQVGTVHVSGSRTQYYTTTGGQPLLATCAPPVTTKVESCPGNIPNQQQGFDPMSGEPLPGQSVGPWQRPGAGEVGDEGRNSLRGPAFYQTDLAVAKNIPITERFRLQFRADAFNVFNTVNLGNPAPVVDAKTGAGQINSLAIGAGQRQLQFSLRLSF